MSDVAQNLPESTSSDENRFAETRLFEPGECLSRQEEDIALAAELLQSGVANEREISGAVSDWSIHGSVSLAQHLESRGLLTAEQISIIKQGAAGRVDRARRSIAGGSEMPEAGKSMLLATLERLDGSGRVAKLLGVTVAARGGENDIRVTEGRYELVRKLGQGGLGRVWLARDVNLNRHVALKEISHAAGNSEAIVERFKHEAEITGRLDHPSIVPIHQLGKDVATGRVFYAMRFLGRTTLQDSISEYHERREAGDEDPMLLRHLLTAFVNVCHAIGHAHSRKVIHRDLKPENVVIDSFGQVIVIDWGLAKIIDEASVESLMDSVSVGGADRTNEGQVLGTPLYMAPEQAAGRLDELDHRTDIYGLGAILFAIVTGYAPHERTQKASIESGVGARGMISVIASGAVPAAREIHAGADPALEAICLKAMARKRYARYQHATVLAEDVQRWMAGEPVTAYEETTWQKLGRWVSQHQRLTQSLVAAAMVVLVALTTLAMAARQNAVAEKRARFTGMASNVHELGFQLRGAAGQLAKDARFLASLPPIEGIVNARDGVKNGDEQAWRGQLESIFSSMVRANADYLAAAFESNQEQGAVDIVRVERNPSDPSLIRVVPESRLATTANDALMAAVAKLEAGDFRFSYDVRARHAERTSNIERLSVASPVYSDTTGKNFGMTVIETDIARRIVDVMYGLGTVNCDIYVADGLGHLWASVGMDYSAKLASPGESIPDLPEEVRRELPQKSKPFRIEQKDEWIAERFYVDPAGRGTLIFARLLDAK